MSQLKGSVKKSVPAVGADAPGGPRGKICVLRIRPGESPIGAHNAGRFVKRPYDMNRYFRLFSQPFLMPFFSPLARQPKNMAISKTQFPISFSIIFVMAIPHNSARADSEKIWA